VSTTEFLNTYRLAQLSRQAGDDLQKSLQSIYGPPDLFAAPLAALAREIELFTHAEQVRSHIMLPTNRPKQSRIVVYQYGFEHQDGTVDHDAALELDEDGGCTGKAWTECAPVAADLEASFLQPEAWNLTADQKNRTPRDRRAMLSVPIFGWYKHRELNRDNRGMLPRIGVLSVDSTTKLTQTGWLINADTIKEDVVRRMQHWAHIIGKLLS
jgi:hypothetical protein